MPGLEELTLPEQARLKAILRQSRDEREAAAREAKATPAKARQPRKATPAKGRKADPADCRTLRTVRPDVFYHDQDKAQRPERPDADAFVGACLRAKEADRSRHHPAPWQHKGHYAKADSGDIRRAAMYASEYARQQAESEEAKRERAAKASRKRYRAAQKAAKREANRTGYNLRKLQAA